MFGDVNDVILPSGVSVIDVPKFTAELNVFPVAAAVLGAATWVSSRRTTADAAGGTAAALTATRQTPTESRRGIRRAIVSGRGLRMVESSRDEWDARRARSVMER